VSQTYTEHDESRYTIERSIAISSTEMQELHERLRTERDHFWWRFSAAPVGMVLSTVHGELLEVNRAFERMLGSRLGESGTRDIATLLHPDDVDAVRDYLLATQTAETGSDLHAARFIAQDNRVVWTQLSMAMLRGTHGAPRVIIVVADVTRQKLLELELLQAQKLESVGRLAAGVAHEINTPVQFVSDSVHFIRDAFNDLAALIGSYRKACAAVDPTGNVSVEQRARVARAEEAADVTYLLENTPKALERCLEGLDRVATIVRSMKEFAHPDQSEMAAADLNRGVANTVTIARNEYKYVADLSMDLGALPQVTCHIGDINQVVLNIIVNAAHAIQDVVDGTDARGRIHVETRPEGPFAVVRISDTGGGIPADVRHRIFDPFFTTKEVGRGTGQGLAIARSIVVDKHQGELTFETEMGRGTTFVVRLPIAGRQSEAA